MEEETVERGLLVSRGGEGEIKETKPNSATPLVVFSTFITVCGSLTFGCALGYTADSMSSIMEDLDISLAQYSLFGSLLTFGGMIGAVFSAKIAALFGRKFTMWFAEIFCAIGWLAVAFAKNNIWLNFGRLFVGIGVGLISYAVISFLQVPIYIAEITPKHIRGAFTFANQLFQNVGISLVYYIGNFFHWRTLAIIGVIPCLMQSVGLFFIPESPRWLAKEGREKDFEIALQKLRGKKTDIFQEAHEIRISVEVSQQSSNLGLRNLFRKRYARQLIVGIGLMLLQQFSGSAGVIYYASNIFELAGFPSQIGMTALSLIMVPKALLGVILVDRWGRRPLLLASAIGMCSSCVILSLAFGIKGIPQFENLTPIMTFIGILVYNTMFAVGMGALPWIIMSEIFPINMKVLAGSIVTIANWSTSWIITYCFNFMLDWSQSGTFIIFSIICGVAIIFTWCLVPETKGLTLEEIQVSFAHILQ